MKVAISSAGTSIDSDVYPRFARCPYFVIYDTDSCISSYIINKEKDEKEGGGIKVAKMISDLKIDSVITGSIGPNAYNFLYAALIEIYSGVTGTAEKNIQRLQKGELDPAVEPDAAPYSGAGQ